MVSRTVSKIRGIIVVVSIVLASVMLTSPCAYPQVAGATLTGTVSDPSGAVIPNAQISINNVATGQERVFTTDSAGFYSSPNLLPGQYTVTVTAAGFSTEVRSGITLTVGGQQRLNITMNVGQVSQKVEVTGEAPAIQLASSTISGVVSQTDVVQLPLNGRDWTQLATLQPGVDSVSSIQANTGSKDRARRGYGAQLSISGSRPQQNNYRIDGISVNDYSNGGPGSVEGSTLGVDAVQEFSVLTSNYSAEYGRTSGGVINAISRQGTNQFHGNAYEFFRNSALDARNFFDPKNIPGFKRNQFGGSFGGPIRKNNTFFFGDYEGLRQSQGITTLVNVPSLAARSGQLCSIPQPGGGCSPFSLTSLTPTTGGALNPDPATGIDKAVLPYLGLWQPPNAGVTGNGDTGIYGFNAVHVTSENFATVRVDQRFSDKDSVFGTYQYDKADLTQPDPANEVLTGNTTGRSYVAIEETHIFNPQLVNSVRFGFSRNTHTSQGVKAINPLSANPSLGASPGAHNPQIDVPGLTSIQPGLNQIELVNFFQNSFQEYDDLFLTKGIHSLKFGFAAERIQLNAFNPAPALEYPFGSIQGFLTNQAPTALFGPLPSAPFVPFAFRSTIFGGYVQDDVRLRPNFTLNLGLRYEMSTVPNEIHGPGRLSALHSVTAPAPVIGNPLFHNPTYRNFEPRLGFAWDPFRNGKTSVRGGFGMFDVLPLPYLLGQFTPNAAPFTESGAVPQCTQPPTTPLCLTTGDFPTGGFSKLSSLILAGTGLRNPFVEQNPKRNYVMQWNLSVQHELLPNFTAMVAYVGSRGVHQAFRADDINTTQATLTSAGYLFPGRDPITGSLLGTQINPNIGQMDTLQWGNHTFYDGLEVQLSKRMSHGFEVQGSFTWSKAIDSGAGTIASDPFVNSIPSLLYFLPKYRRAVSDFNVSRNLTVNYMWNVPAPKSFHGPTAWVSRGWQIGGIFELRSGLPFTPLIGGDPLGLGNTSPFAYPARLTGAGCGSLVNPGNPTNYIKLQCFSPPMSTAAISAQCIPFSSLAGSCSNLLGSGGRNEVYGPGLVNFDFSVFKDNKIRERLNLQFRAEFFNVFNRANFNSPIANSMLFDNTGASVNNAGAFDSTATTSREIQFALKLIF
jgi:Carboxypeptidase regulatory-like domain/TonB dependent receptor-like, beta-barrel/TonB-dependent Receptor Plug Domain